MATTAHDSNVNVLVDAKAEYTKQLIQVLQPQLMAGIISIYDEAYTLCKDNNEESLTMLTFQELLSQVPKWNQVLISDETERIVDESECDYFDDLLTAVFVCHTKILTTVRVTNKNRRINLKIPSAENFIHMTYIEIAREFWKHPYLLNPFNVTKLAYQQNLSLAEERIRMCLERTIRKLLPVKNILKEYLAEDDSAGEEEDEETATSSQHHKEDSTQVGGASTQDNTTEYSSKKDGAGSESSSASSSAACPKNNATHEEAVIKAKKELGLGSTEDENEDESATTTLKTTNELNTSTSAETPSGVSTTESTPTEFDKMLLNLHGNEKTSDTSQNADDGTPTNVKTIEINNGSTPKNDSSSKSDTNVDTQSTTDITEIPTSSSEISGETSAALPDLLSKSSTASSEISLDNLGDIEEVSVDFGNSSLSGSSMNSSAAIKSEVIGEFDKMTASSTSSDATSSSSTASTSSATSNTPPAKYDFF